jgi:hypothetical protein
MGGRGYYLLAGNPSSLTGLSQPANHFQQIRPNQPINRTGPTGNHGYIIGGLSFKFDRSYVDRQPLIQYLKPEQPNNYTPANV